MANYLLVHGGDRDGSIWHKTARYLEAQGHVVLCPSMRSVKEASLQQNIAEIMAVIQEAQLWPLLLVGHSYGGMVITGVADQLQAHQISRLVYVDSVIPKSGYSLYGLLAQYGLSYQDFDLTPDPACLDKINFDAVKFACLPKVYIQCLQSEFRKALQPMWNEVTQHAARDHWLYFSLDTIHSCMLTEPLKLASILTQLHESG